MECSVYRSSSQTPGTLNLAGDALFERLVNHPNPPSSDDEVVSLGWVQSLIDNQVSPDHKHTTSQITVFPAGLDLSKLSYLDSLQSNAATQLSGCLPLTGGTATGVLTTTKTATENNDVVNKKQVDLAFANVPTRTGVAVGAVIEFALNWDDDGYLRADKDSLPRPNTGGVATAYLDLYSTGLFTSSGTESFYIGNFTAHDTAYGVASYYKL